MKHCWMFNQRDLPGNRIQVVLPVCTKDCGLMLDNLRWQRELDGIKDFSCVLSADDSTPKDIVDELEDAAWETFLSVKVYYYDTAPNPAWPNGPNWAFQHAALYMMGLGSAWFWMEPDCLPIRPGWLKIWNMEYWLHRKPIMGVIVPGMGHCNGTAVYPANFPKLSPSAMTCTNDAWDGVMRWDTIKLTHDVPRLLCHVWGIENGIAVPFGGETAHFKTQHDVFRWVDLNAILFHRAKDSSLIDRLRELKDESIGYVGVDVMITGEK